MDFKYYLVKSTMDFICFCVFSSTFNPLVKTSELDCCTKLNQPGWAQIGPNTPMLRINILLGFFHFKPIYVQWFFSMPAFSANSFGLFLQDSISTSYHQNRAWGNQNWQYFFFVRLKCICKQRLWNVDCLWNWPICWNHNWRWWSNVSRNYHCFCKWSAKY